MRPEEGNAVSTPVDQSTTTDSAPVETTTDDGANAQVSDLNSDNFFEDVDAQVAEGNQAETENTADAPVDSQGQPRGDDGRFVKKEETLSQTQELTPDQPLAPKSQNRFQQLANERKQYAEENSQLKAQIERLKSQESQFATEQELLGQINPETGDYYTPAEVERVAFQQTREQQAQSVAQQRYTLEVQQNQQVLATEAQSALQDFPMFDETSKDYNPALSAQADALLRNSLIIENGTIVGATHSPYQIYKTIADATRINAPQMQAQAQQAVERMQANADISPSASQATKTKVDPMMDAFDLEASFL